jgi:hypothetical protein
LLILQAPNATSKCAVEPILRLLYLELQRQRWM